MIKNIKSLLCSGLFIIIFMMMNSIPVSAAEDNEITNILDPTTSIGTLAVIGTGGAGAVAVSRNNKKRKERLTKNNQVIDVNKTYHDKDLNL